SLGSSRSAVQSGFSVDASSSPIAATAASRTFSCRARSSAMDVRRSSTVAPRRPRRKTRATAAAPAATAGSSSSVARRIASGARGTGRLIIAASGRRSLLDSDDERGSPVEAARLFARVVVLRALLAVAPRFETAGGNAARDEVVADAGRAPLTERQVVLGRAD